MWIDDVASLQVISSVDHNNRRNRLVQTFDTIAERDSHGPALPVGAMAYVGANDTLYQRRGAGWRTVFTPYTNYVPAVSVGTSTLSAGTVNVTRGRWRRSYGNHIDYELALVVAPIPMGVSGVIVVALPWPLAGYAAALPILGMGSVSPVPGSPTMGPAVANTDAAVSVLDAAGAYVAVPANTSFQFRLNVAYETAEG